MNRPPIVTVMGHVDHGKTSLLDALRNTSIVTNESGGITQHIGASQIEYNGKKITFIDTPGHAAFSEMRLRGGQAADIVILVVAANDGVMPQTKEAISHAKAAGVPIIVAINKIDLPDKNLPKIKNQLIEQELVLEEYGGDVIGVEVSATQKINLDKLLDSIVVLSEMIEKEDSKDRDLGGFVLESKHDPKRGFTATLILTNGVLKLGEEIVIGNRLVSKVKSITSFTGESLKSLEAGDPGEILGLKESVKAGEKFERFTGQELKEVTDNQPQDIDFTVKENEDLNVILRADTAGTLEAIVSSLSKLEVENRKIKFLLKDVGDVKENDLLLASVSKGIILAFKVNVPGNVSDKAKDLGVLIREYDVIYEMLEELEGALEGMHEIHEEKVKGRAEIRKIFPLPSGDVVAGCFVTHGRLRQGDTVSIRSENDPTTEVFKSKIKTVKKATENVNTVGKNTECGILLNAGHEELKSGYVVEVL